MLDNILYCITRIKIRLIELGIECTTSIDENHKIKLLAIELRQLVCALHGTPNETLYENARQVLWLITGRWTHIHRLKDIEKSMRHVLAYLANYGSPNRFL
jgi:hypothetical protein